MRMLSGVEAPDRGTRREGHQVVMQYFAQDEAGLDPGLTVYETLSAGSPLDGTGDSQHPRRFPVHRRRRLQEGGRLSGGERTRLAVARMLLRPSNTLLLDEPTNHLDLDSKDILLEALEDYGGTLVFVSHDRYFVEEAGDEDHRDRPRRSRRVPGMYPEFSGARRKERCVVRQVR